MSATVIFWAYKDQLMLSLVIVSSVFSGVKGVYFGEFILLTLLLIFDNKYSKRFKIKWVAICFVVFATLLSIIFSTKLFQNVIKKDGFLSAIFSYRIDNLIDTMRSSGENFNILIGAIGIPVIRLELQIIDIILLFGISGIVVYIYFAYSLFKDIIKDRTSKAFFIAAIFLSFLSGNLFYIPFAITLFVITLFTLNTCVINKNFDVK